MALLQNNSNNILFVDGTEEAEAVTIMESPKKLVEAHEAKNDVKAETDVQTTTGESSGDQNMGTKESMVTETDAPEMSSSKPSETVGSDMDATTEEAPKSEKDEVMDDGKDEKEEAADDEEEEEDEENEKKKKGIYDMPLEVEGKRERHKVDRITFTSPPIKKTTSTMPMGDGVPLGEIAYVEDQLKKHSGDVLKTMHRVLYGHPGKASTVKREIRKFTGFAFKEDSQEFKKKVAFLHKLSLDQLKTIKSILGLQSGGQSKDAVITTIMVFLMKTVDHARRVAKKRRSSAGKTPSSVKRPRKSKDKIDHTTDDDDENEGDEKKSTSEAPPSGNSAKKPRKSKQNDKSKEVPSKSDTGNDSDDKKKKKKKSKTESKDSDADSTSSTSVATLQETKPSEKELEDVIEELLSQVDLSQVSMKQMCQAVIEKFPGTNIGNRVDYLKSLIKQSLSTK
ncbi:hypothetical protein KIN20_031729 [Parelaphostrongylus tenuis]|uniref:DEK-C domain-containing protein n=1 Tax=Parelaphostrongylus tenuis TaxID=148309 RepID=A0AAD5R5U3_PARTN|nr:hypothetical protein KIN20_031729 [Parelaphostrongylus tenuis]